MFGVREEHYDAVRIARNEPSLKGIEDLADRPAGDDLEAPAGIGGVWHAAVVVGVVVREVDQMHAPFDGVAAGPAHRRERGARVESDVAAERRCAPRKACVADTEVGSVDREDDAVGVHAGEGVPNVEVEEGARRVNSPQRRGE